MRWRSRSLTDTQRAGRTLGQLLLEEPGAVVALCGPLGAGKTHFVKGVAAGLGIDPALVTSPTFVVANELAVAGGRGRLVHADLYRLESPVELEAAGWLDWLGADTWLFVEWADRFPAELPADHLVLSIQPVAGEPDARALEAHGEGEGADRICRRWARALGAA